MSFSEIIGKFCYARACTVSREYAYLMCRQHWAMVPTDVQRQVVRAMGRYSRHPQAAGAKTQLHEAMLAARMAVEKCEAHAEEARVRENRRARSAAR